MCSNQYPSIYHLNDEQRNFFIPKLLQEMKQAKIRKSCTFNCHKPSLSTIYDLKKKVQQTGIIKNRKCQGYPVTVSTKELEKGIEKNEMNHHSVRRMVSEMNMGKTTV